MQGRSNDRGAAPLLRSGDDVSARYKRRCSRQPRVTGRSGDVVGACWRAIIQHAPPSTWQQGVFDLRGVADQRHHDVELSGCCSWPQAAPLKMMHQRHALPFIRCCGRHHAHAHACSITRSPAWPPTHRPADHPRAASSQHPVHTQAQVHDAIISTQAVLLAQSLQRGCRLIDRAQAIADAPIARR